MHVCFGANALLLQDFEEVFTLQEGHSELLCLSFDILFKDDLLKEVLRCLVRLQQMHHEHNHYFDGLLVQPGQV